MIFDTHAHYDDEAFQADRAEVLNELSASGIRRVVNVGANRESTENSLKLAEEYRDKALLDNDYASHSYARDMEQEHLYGEARKRVREKEGG